MFCLNAFKIINGWFEKKLIAYMVIYGMVMVIYRMVVFVALCQNLVDNFV